MDDIAQVLADNQAVIGVVIGTLLGYVLNALNRHHQEVREKETRWYDARFKAYADLSRAFTNSLMYMTQSDGTEEERKAIAQGFAYAVGTIRVVGSEEAKKAAGRVLVVVTDETNKGEGADPYGKHLGAALEAFGAAARKDLGLPHP